MITEWTLPKTLYRIAELPEALIRRWDALLLSVPERSAFLSHRFCAAVEKARGGVFVLHLLDGETEGFLPYQLLSGRSMLGHAEKVGGSISDSFGLIGNLRESVNPLRILKSARLSSLRFDHALPALCPFSFEDRATGYGVRLTAQSLEELKQRLLQSNKSFVKTVESRERRVARELGAIRFTWTATDVAGELHKLIAAKRAQYARTGVTDALGESWRRQLLLHLASGDGDRTCRAILSTLYADGHWLASKLSLICEDTLHSWFSVYDPRYSRHGSGHLLWFKVIEAACERGIRTFDFGEGESGYKAEYGGEKYEVQKGAIRRATPAGRAEPMFEALRWRLEWFSNRARSKRSSEAAESVPAPVSAQAGGA